MSKLRLSSHAVVLLAVGAIACGGAPDAKTPASATAPAADDSAAPAAKGCEQAAAGVGAFEESYRVQGGESDSDAAGGARRARDVIAQRCTEDGWPPEAIACYESWSEPAKERTMCHKQLTPEQQKKLEAAASDIQSLYAF
jgi:hypothetical protein